MSRRPALYVFELASVNSTGTPSNALDTLLVIYAGTFTPGAPAPELASMMISPVAARFCLAPYAANGVTVASTGFTGANPGSRQTFNLTAGTTYFLPVTSSRDTTCVGTWTTAQPVGNWYLGANGPGTINVVPEPRPPRFWSSPRAAWLFWPAANATLPRLRPAQRSDKAARIGSARAILFSDRPRS